MAMFCFAFTTANLVDAQGKPASATPTVSAARRTEAKATYESVCATCHGLDARGSERGPDIVSRPEVVRKSDAQLFGILKNGMTAAGMPAFSAFGSVKLNALVAYLRTLQGGGGQAPLPGNAANGKILFFGKANCAECHMVSGQGGFFGPELTTYAARLDAEQVRADIVNPNKDLDPRRGLVSVTLNNSTSLSGLARNEDNFSLQLQTPDGVFHLLNKSDIRAQTYAGISAMPSDYGSRLSGAELNDLISFLLRISRTKQPQNDNGHPQNVDED
jgi:putative heme-binding domain-containing protein